MHVFHTIPVRLPVPKPRVVGNQPVLSITPLGPWVNDAACARAEPTLFDAPGGDDGLTVEQRAKGYAAAATFCRRCTVRDECLADAIANGNSGVRGGVLIRDNGSTTDLLHRGSTPKKRTKK